MEMKLKEDKYTPEETGLYVLKHKDLDVAMVQVNMINGGIDYVLEVYLPQELPIGCSPTGDGLIEWWRERAIPDTRRGILQALRILGEVADAVCIWAESVRSFLDAAGWNGAVLEGPEFL